MRRVTVTLGLALALSACAGQVPHCPAGAERMQVAELLFGHNIGDKLGVSEADFRRFVDEELTPRFPDGLTIVNASGQWREGDRIVREPSKVVLIAIPDAPDVRAKLDAARDAYKRRFKQQAVGLILRSSCVSF